MVEHVELWRAKVADAHVEPPSAERRDAIASDSR